MKSIRFMAAWAAVLVGSAIAVIVGTMLLSANPAAQPRPAELPHRFSVKEMFGVSHPRQIIDFDAIGDFDLNAVYMLGPDGTEVPFQILTGRKIAVQSDLPARATRSWTLMPGRAPQPMKRGVRVTRGPNFYEITNDLTGVRIALPRKDLKETPAPVQGIRYRDGHWTATGPNLLSATARRMDVRFVERGPLKVVVEVSYHLPRPELRQADQLVAPAGEGFYRSTIELQAGQPTILFEEETNVDVSYSLDIYEGLRPTQGRYRGHGATSPEAGRSPDGSQYSGRISEDRSDALVDLQYSVPQSYPRMAIWEPYIRDSGWYWQMYEANAASPEGNLLGIFAGSPSRALGAGGSGVNLSTVPGSGSGSPETLITISSTRHAPGGRVYPLSRFAWGAFAGSRAEDLKDPQEVQTINRQMNLHGGINLNKLHRYGWEYPDPPGGYGGLYVEKAVVRRLAARLRPGLGSSENALKTALDRADPAARDMIEAWADTSGEKNRNLVANILDTTRRLLDALVNGNGIYDSNYHYWLGALEMSRKGPWIDQVLANPLTSPEQKALVKASAALFGNLLWDDDFVPLFEGHGLNMGNENMAVMQQGARDFYTLFLAGHPHMVGRTGAVEQRTRKTLHSIVNEHGAEIGAVHYIEPSFLPTLNTLLQLRVLGKDRFKTEPRLASFAEFYMNFLTPAEPRFGGLRKVVSIGDGSTEAAQVVGPLSTGFRDANPKLSARLMGAWHATGQPHSSFFGSTFLKIDEQAPAEDPRLGSAAFAGWYSVLRYGWGSKNETALWFVNGDFYRDHRHADHGSVVVYALGAPLSIDWGSTYEPRVSGSFMHSMVVPEAAIGVAPDAQGAPSQGALGWAADSPPLNAADFVWGVGPWGHSAQESFVSLHTVALATARFTSPVGTIWTRTTQLLHPNENYPILVIHDSFAGQGASENKVFTMNLMAKGDVDTPAGKMSPPLRTFNNQWHPEAAKRELPSAGPIFTLRPGLNRLGFRGQWIIDWDLYTHSTGSQEALVGNWAHNWHPGLEQGQFLQANSRPFEERQHILRIRGNGAFRVLILPYRKGEARADLQVRQQGSNSVITAGNETTVVGEGFYSYRSPLRHILATFSTEAVSGAGLRLAGGPTEVIVEPARTRLTVHGASGLRRVTLPGSWKVEGTARGGTQLVRRGEEWLFDYRGGQPQTFTLVKAGS